MIYQRPVRSQLIEAVMPDAIEAEKADATDRLFSVIEIIDRMVTRLEYEVPEKLPSSKLKSEPEKPSTPETLPLL